MIVEPGTYTATLPSDMDRVDEAKSWLKTAGGELLDWGFGEDGGIDVKFSVTKSAEWPKGLPNPKLLSAPIVHVPATSTPATKKAKAKAKPAKKNNLGTLLFLWLLMRGS